MSKTAEHKAWLEYPTPLDNDPFISKGFVEEKQRIGYIKGYDQACSDIKSHMQEVIKRRMNLYSIAEKTDSLYGRMGELAWISDLINEYEIQ